MINAPMSQNTCVERQVIGPFPIARYGSDNNVAGTEITDGEQQSALHH